MVITTSLYTFCFPHVCDFSGISFFWLSFHLRCRVRSGKTVTVKKELTKTVYTLYGDGVGHAVFTLSIYLFRVYALPDSIPRFRCGCQRDVVSCVFTIWITLWIWKFLNGIYTFTRYTILCALLRANFSDLLIDCCRLQLLYRYCKLFISWLSDITIG